jgi:hypothetical protein
LRWRWRDRNGNGKCSTLRRRRQWVGDVNMCFSFRSEDGEMRKWENERWGIGHQKWEHCEGWGLWDVVSKNAWMICNRERRIPLLPPSPSPSPKPKSKS